MPDLALIGATLSSIKSALDIVKALRDQDQALGKAELKAQLVDLMESLADAKIALLEVQDVLNGKDAEIAELRGAFEYTGKLTRDGDAYYESDSQGDLIRTPYCIRCWDADRKRRALVDTENHRVLMCVECRTVYRLDRVRRQ